MPKWPSRGKSERAPRGALVPPPYGAAPSLCRPQMKEVHPDKTRLALARQLGRVQPEGVLRPCGPTVSIHVMRWPHGLTLNPFGKPDAGGHRFAETW